MKSKNNYIIGALILLVIQMGCTTQEKSTVVVLDEDALVGTWRLIRTIEIGHEDSTNRRDGAEKYYVKNINNNHFIWVEYDRINNKLLGTGGGTYTLKDNIYTENIQFYYPPGANEMGQAIPFSAEINEDGVWHHTGYAKLMEFDPETAENVMVDSAIIDELWERIDLEPADDTNGKLVGTWMYEDGLNQGDSTYTEFPPFFGVIKMLSPTYFTWVQYNTEADEIFAIGGGSYKINGDQYIERIDFVHPGRQDQIGADAVYTWKQDSPDHWNISGAVQGRDSLQYFDENWKRYMPEREMDPMATNSN